MAVERLYRVFCDVCLVAHSDPFPTPREAWAQAEGLGWVLEPTPGNVERWRMRCPAVHVDGPLARPVAEVAGA